jgi:hypothetical protein
LKTVFDTCASCKLSLILVHGMNGWRLKAERRPKPRD